MVDSNVSLEGDSFFSKLENELQRDPRNVAASIARAELRQLASFCSYTDVTGDQLVDYTDPMRLLFACKQSISSLVAAYLEQTRPWGLNIEDKNAAFTSNGPAGEYQIEADNLDEWRIQMIPHDTEIDAEVGNSIIWSRVTDAFDTKDAELLLEDLEKGLSAKELLNSELNAGHPRMFTSVVSASQIFPEEPQWDFWKDWFQSFLDENPIGWELQKLISEIDISIWRKGPIAVSHAIANVQANLLESKAPVSEQIAFDHSENKFATIPINLNNPQLLGAILDQVEDSLDTALENQSNGLSNTSRETRSLRRIIKKYGNDPQRIEMGFESVRKGLTRQILNDELPASEDNLALSDALEEGARGIRGTHPEVAENRKILNEQAIRELPTGAVEQLTEALPILTAISDEALAEEWKQDIPQLINDATTPLPSGAPSLPGAEEATRIFNRAAKISLLLKSKDIIHSIDGSAGYKAARILTTVTALVSLGLMIF